VLSLIFRVHALESPAKCGRLHPLDCTSMNNSSDLFLILFAFAADVKDI